METAVGAKGWVVLHNRELLSLPAREQPINLFGTGWLKLRAAQEVKPVLIVELKTCTQRLCDRQDRAWQGGRQPRAGRTGGCGTVPLRLVITTKDGAQP